jgi:hypothetical protein
MGELSESVFKSPSIPLYQRGMTMDSPLWYLFPAGSRQRGVRGDFIEVFNSIGVIR